MKRTNKPIVTKTVRPTATGLTELKDRFAKLERQVAEINNHFQSAESQLSHSIGELRREYNGLLGDVKRDMRELKGAQSSNHDVQLKAINAATAGAIHRIRETFPNDLESVREELHEQLREMIAEAPTIEAKRMADRIDTINARVDAIKSERGSRTVTINVGRDALD